ncbi:MAG TPA: hypothetical protein VGI16_08560 [Candidatus Acidoferrum sp.]
MVRFLCCVISVTLLLVLVAPPPLAFACGPFFPVTVFIETQRPDFPLYRFAAGQLGILRPNLPRSYLTAAYRYLSGGTFDASEQHQLVTLWTNRLYGDDFVSQNHPSDDARDTWLNARLQVVAHPGNDGLFFRTKAPAPSLYLEYDNCSRDAFATAAHTLKLRAQQFGPDSEICAQLDRRSGHCLSKLWWA